MNELVIMKNQQAVTDSLTVAHAFQKQHKNVLQVIDEVKKRVAEKSATPNNAIFIEGVYEHPQNHQKYRIVYMNRKAFVLTVTGFTGERAFEFKNKYIDAFDAMEIKLREQPRLPQTPQELLDLVVRNVDDSNKKVEKMDHRLTDLEENQTLSPGEYNYISRRINRTVSQYVDIHHMVLNAKQRSKLFKDINHQVNEVSGIKTRTQLRKKHFEVVDKFITNWTPSTATLELIKQISGEAKGQTELIK